MIKFNLFEDENYDELLDMMTEFYTSDAVDTPLKKEVITRLLDDILSRKHSIKGIEIHYKKSLVGFGTITTYYTSEIAGETVQLEDLFIKDEYRSKGIAKKYFNEIMDRYKDAKRFRLEVCATNLRAIKLYKEIGFRDLNYNQMTIDK